VDALLPLNALTTVCFASQGPRTSDFWPAVLRLLRLAPALTSLDVSHNIYLPVHELAAVLRGAQRHTLVALSLQTSETVEALTPLIAAVADYSTLRHVAFPFHSGLDEDEADDDEWDDLTEACKRLVSSGHVVELGLPALVGRCSQELVDHILRHGLKSRLKILGLGRSRVTTAAIKQLVERLPALDELYIDPNDQRVPSIRAALASKIDQRRLVLTLLLCRRVCSDATVGWMKLPIDVVRLIAQFVWWSFECNI